MLGRPTKEDIVKQDPGAEAQTLLSQNVLAIAAQTQTE